MTEDMEFNAILDNGTPVTIHCEVEDGQRILDLFAQDGSGREIPLSPTEQTRIEQQAYQNEIPNLIGGQIDRTYDADKGASNKVWIIDASM